MTMRTFPRSFSIHVFSRIDGETSVNQAFSACVIHPLASPMLPFLLAICLSREYMCMRSMREL